MLVVLAIPLFLQAIAMAVDEGLFHRMRGLSRWERIGHPLDTLTVIAALLFLRLAPPSPTNLHIYIGLAAFSCLFVTKDEPVHTKHCSATENWLHAVLFVLHPVTFLVLGLAWTNERTVMFSLLLTGQIALTLAFLLFQIFYWNGPWAATRARLQNEENVSS